MKGSWVAAVMIAVTALGAAGPAWAQQGTSPRPRPARPAPAAPAAKPAEPAAPKPADSGPARTPDLFGRSEKNGPVTVDADQLENRQKEGLIVFTGNVVASQNSSTQYADRMEVYLDANGDSIARTVSTGNVRIVTKDCRMGTAHRAEYYDAEQRVVLIGNARVWRDDNVVSGERITIYLAEDRSVVEGGTRARVKAVFYPRGEEAPSATAKPPAGAPCG